MYHDVDVLLCGGIEQFYFGMIRGHGIKVIPDATGAVLEVLDGWIRGNLRIPQLWPYCPHKGAPGRKQCRQKRRRGGLQSHN
jgi:predicted Fe-Mo cluster-binding NifX family protein